ncbi:DUF2017 domain-containing protein [Actinobacteria bacterium YIM 96077]|uniref:DUF2017 domain-containing protein n=1 Tax=Phytoactinopolyspora halophila TaxID=1981511 RepID=A0A329R324_9ACTN|nr:DUF2017 domain-containing protein [Actinobacteria bacterium YIM 96077]RAW18941.1 DUF2017 domain-containing protein [Phytoactinopolyspora halophila]
MSTAFRRARGGGVTASFHAAEIELLRSLVGQLLELVRGDQTHKQDEDWAAALGLAEDEPKRPTDPVLLRLFPDGYDGDDEGAADFRRFTERGLREAKSDNAATVLASLATTEGIEPEERRQRNKTRIELDAHQAEAWLRTLTDLRLALGTRLGVSQDDEDEWERLPEDDPRRHIHDVYNWLGWLQETLVRTLSAGLE